MGAQSCFDDEAENLAGPRQIHPPIRTFLIVLGVVQLISIREGNSKCHSLEGLKIVNFHRGHTHIAVRLRRPARRVALSHNVPFRVSMSSDDDGGMMAPEFKVITRPEPGVKAAHAPSLRHDESGRANRICHGDDYPDTGTVRTAISETIGSCEAI